jgi:hypothetical protein
MPTRDAPLDLFIRVCFTMKYDSTTSVEEDRCKNDTFIHKMSKRLDRKDHA